MNRPWAPRPVAPAPGGARGPIRIGAGYRRTVNVVAAGVWATGVLWLVFHYFLRAPGPFGPEPSPLEAWWLRLHGAFAFGAVWTVGLLSASHLLNGWASGRRRHSGVALLAVAVVLSLTGYLLYYASGDAVRAVIAMLHWVLGLGAPLVFAWHRYLRSRRRGRLDFTGDGTGG